MQLNFARGGCRPRYAVLHIMQGTLAGTDSWFRNPDAQVSSHFGVGKTGTVYQWVDTADTAWHVQDANGYAIGIENEGHAGDVLTPPQLEAVAGIFAWVCAHHAVALAITNDVSAKGSGLAWHGMGGAAWGDHPGCPGAPIVAQRPAILAAAKPQPPPPPVPEDDMPFLVYVDMTGAPAGTPSAGIWLKDGGSYTHMEPATGKVDNVVNVKSLGIRQITITYNQHLRFLGK